MLAVAEPGATSVAVQPELSMLGGFVLRLDGARVEVPDSSQRLLVYLALRDRPQQRHVVAGDLWPDSTEARAAANLRSSLWRIPRTGAVPLVITQDHALSIAAHVCVDVRQVESLGWSLVQDPELTIPTLDRTAFYAELLPGWYDDWVIVERERLAQLRLHFLEALTYSLIRSGHLAEALDVGLRLVASDPLRERSQRALITAYRAEGSHGQAARQLQRFRALMVETFHCEPSDDLADLVAAPPSTSRRG